MSLLNGSYKRAQWVASGMAEEDRFVGDLRAQKASP